MKSIGNMCYCYNEECNQKEWEKQGKEGKRQYTIVEALYSPELMKGQKVPRCPYCKKKMTITANLDYSM